MGHMIMTKNSSRTGCPLKITSSTPAAGTSMGLHPMTCTHHAFWALWSRFNLRKEALLMPYCACS